MKDKPNDIESQLHDQQVAELDPALLDRLEAALEGELTQLSQAELAFESELRAIRPNPMKSDLLQRLEAKVDGLPAPTQVHVLPFPGANAEATKRRAGKQAAGLAVAAAVALLGALTALLIDPSSTGPTTADQAPGSRMQDTRPLPTFVSDLPADLPAEFSRALSDTSDQGYIWPANDEPHRVLKVTYTDRVTMQRDDGTTIEVEQPRVEYYLVPIESH